MNKIVHVQNKLCLGTQHAPPLKKALFKHYLYFYTNHFLITCYNGLDYTKMTVINMLGHE